MIPEHVGEGGWVGWDCSAVVAPPPPGRNALFWEVPQRRRQLGGTGKLGVAKKHLLGEVPKGRRQLGGTGKLVTAYVAPKFGQKPGFRA